MNKKMNKKMKSRKSKQKQQYTKKYKRGGKDTTENDDVRKCMNSMCSEKDYNEIFENSKKMFENILEEGKKKMSNLNPEQQKVAEKNIKDLERIVKEKNDKNYKKKTVETMRKGCEDLYCNKGCVGTLYQDGGPNMLPDKLKKLSKPMVEYYSEERKKMFKNKNSVLKDNFYEGLGDKLIKKMKKKGATSGCNSSYIDLKNFMK